MLLLKTKVRDMTNTSIWKRLTVSVLIIVFVCVALGGAWYAWYHLSGTADRDRLSAHVFLACSIGTDYECDENRLIATYPDAATFCEQIHGNTKPMNYDAYAFCLESEGMVFE